MLIFHGQEEFHSATITNHGNSNSAPTDRQTDKLPENAHQLNTFRYLSLQGKRLSFLRGIARSESSGISLLSENRWHI